MEICIMTPKNPPKLGKREICFKRKLPYWIPESDSNTKAQTLTVKIKKTFTVYEKSLKEKEKF